MMPTANEEAAKVFEGNGCLCLKPSLFPSSRFESLLSVNKQHSESVIVWLVSKRPPEDVDDFLVLVNDNDSGDRITGCMVINHGMTSDDWVEADDVSPDAFKYLYIPLDQSGGGPIKSAPKDIPSELYVTLGGNLYVSGDYPDEVYEPTIIASTMIDLSHLNIVQVNIDSESSILPLYNGNDIQLTISRPSLEDFSAHGYDVNSDPQSAWTIDISEVNHTITVSDIPVTVTPIPAGYIQLFFMYTLNGYYGSARPRFTLELYDSNNELIDTVGIVDNNIIPSAVYYSNNGMTKSGILEYSIPWNYDSSTNIISVYSEFGSVDHLVATYEFYCPAKGTVTKQYRLNLNFAVNGIPDEEPSEQ